MLGVKSNRLEDTFAAQCTEYAITVTSAVESIMYHGHEA